MISKQLQQMGLTPGKALLIGVLILVFIGAVMSNFMGGDSDTTTSASSKRRSVPTPVSRDVKRKLPKIAEGLTDKSDAELRTWPNIALAEAIRHDPFALPVPLRPPAKEVVKAEQQDEKQQNEIDEEALRQQRLLQLRQLRQKKLEKIRSMQQTGVAIVLVTPEERVIKIGNQKLQVGDLWEGFRITEIRPDGSVVVDIE